MKKDLVVGIVGTAILLAAMVGVFNYEAARGGGQAWAISWATATAEGPGSEGLTQVGGTTPAELNVTALNLTRIAFTLTWTDDVGAPDTFNLTIGSPDGKNWSAQGSGGDIVVEAEDLSRIPGEMRLLAATQEEAASRVARDTTSAAGTGVWTAFVRLVDAPGLRPAGDVEVQPDGKNAWTLGTTLTSYAPQFEQG